MDAVRRQDEAVRDWSQAERDEREFDDRKRRVRNVVYQGGRGFEIDGNCDLFRDEAHNAESAACGEGEFLIDSKSIHDGES